MGAGLQRWWRDYDAECEAWSSRDIARQYVDGGVVVTVYTNGTVQLHDPSCARRIVLDQQCPRCSCVYEFLEGHRCPGCAEAQLSARRMPRIS